MDDKGFLPTALEGISWPFSDVLGIPLIDRQNGPIGVFLLLDKIDGSSFSENDENIMSLLSAQAAIAIANARLFGEVQHKAERVAIINKIQEIISSSLEIKDVFESFACEVRKIVDFDRACLTILDQSATEVEIIALYGAQSVEAIEGYRFPSEGTAILWVIQNSVPQIETDLAQERLYKDDSILASMGLRSVLRLPFFSKGKVIGTFNLSSMQPNLYAERDVEALGPILKELGTAVENRETCDAQRSQTRFAA